VTVGEEANVTDQERSGEPLPSEVLPHHVSDEIPGALAHVRVMNRFFDEIERTGAAMPTVVAALSILYEDILADVLEPYAVDLARSLAELEDFPDPEAEP
jgi:hypothetical protein